MEKKRPPSKKAIARQRLFDLCASNWNVVKQHPKIRVTPDIDDVFVCPLCFRCFTRECLDSNLLALEHIPPEALGGKDKDCTLTCTKCNSDTGSQLESPLKAELEISDVFARVPGASLDIQYCPLPGGENMWLPATFKSRANGFDISGHPHRSHPKLIETVSTDDFMKNVTEFRARFRKRNPQYATAALLKVAYLYAFRVFGYGAIIPESMQSVREQILHPTDSILPKGWVVNWSFLDDVPGISLVFWPNDLRAYLVVFDLDSGRRKRRFGVVLPEPDDADFKVYKRLVAGMSSEAALVTIQETSDLVSEPDLCFYSHTVWKQYYSTATNILCAKTSQE